MRTASSRNSLGYGLGTAASFPPCRALDGGDRRFLRAGRKQAVSSNSTQCTSSWADFTAQLGPNGLVPVSYAGASEEQRANWAIARKAVGGAIRAERLKVGLTQEALALESGVTRNMLIHLEHGTRAVSFERIYDLARALGIPAQLLVPDTEAD